MSEEKIQAMESKSALIEKITFALLPLLFSCVVYLMSALSNLAHEVTILNSKISLVVTSDNRQAPNSGAELAREKLRQDLEKEIQIKLSQEIVLWKETGQEKGKNLCLFEPIDWTSCLKLVRLLS